ncbi:MAG: DUF3857 domain-containing protein [Bacteroidetes bacterium]|nr:DUF3857 domain-containing protein [Bacteroidota bacterium]
MRFLFFLFLIPSVLSAQSQNGFPFGSITYANLDMKKYAKDTSASALVLNEFAETRISNDENSNLVFDYHVKIKILKREGFEQANFEIPLRVDKSVREEIREIQASTFNYENNSIKESKVDSKSIFTENRNKYYDLKKFTLPNVKIGSIIEIHYVLESPFIFNWHTWEFQSDIPKVYSEFWARIPGNYVYNIVLRGPLALSKNESSIDKDCYSPGGGMMADCAFFKYAIKDIPAFKEEKYMTAKNNFISSVHFELSEVKKFNGTVVKYTEEWKDVNEKLQRSEFFGDQIKQARKIWADQVKMVTTELTDPLAQAKNIFNTIKKYYIWNDVYGKYSDLGVKKAYQAKKGNVADINLSLVGALQAAGLQVEPALVSTRDNGLPVMLHPVMSDFNYVIARLTIGTEQFWLDATHPLHPFGFVPERCLNGKVRIIGKVSDWVDLKPKVKDKSVTEIVLNSKDGKLVGTMKVTHDGYDAFEQRKKYFSFSTREDYWKEQAKKWNAFEVKDYACQGVDSLEKPFTEIYQIDFTETTNASIIYFSPFIVGRWEKNPFRSPERNFPVDFGAPLEEIIMFSLQIPTEYTADELPRNTAMSLAQRGGSYFFNTSVLNNKIQMTSNLTLNKPVYSAAEYHSLKELFSRIIQTQESQIVLKKK